MKISLITILPVFAAGLVVGALVQRQLGKPAVPAARVEAAASDVAPPVPGSERVNDQDRQTRLSQPAVELSWEGGSAPATREQAEFPREPFARSWPTNEPPPWVRGDWTNREAWMAQRAEEMRQRAAVQRSNFVAEAKLSEDEATRFDVLVAAMNIRLEQKVAEWRAILEDGAIPRPESRARAMKEISEILVMTYDELDRNMPEGWRDEAGTNFNLNTFVDPELWREMRPLMRGGFRGGPPPGGGGFPGGPGR